MKLYIVGQSRVENSDGIVWEFQGVFDTKEKAIDACLNRMYWYQPVELNATFPDETVPGDGIYPHP